MRRVRRGLGTFALALALAGADGPSRTIERATGDEGSPLGMSRAVVCASVGGFRDYEPLEIPERTRDDKLVIYYEPEHYAYERTGPEAYRISFSQDAVLRKKGSKAVLKRKDRFLTYEGTSKVPPSEVFLSNSINLKPYGPGEYVLEIILRDEIGGGEPATQTVEFRIVAQPPGADPKASRSNEEPTALP